MAEFFIPAPYQRDATRHLLANPECMLFAKPGTGKTGIALSVLKITKAKALIIAPLSVAQTTWPNEVKKWLQFRRLDVSIAHGKNKQSAFSHDITVINVDGIKWLFDNQDFLKGKDTLIVDESTFFKTWSSKRTKMMRKMAPLFSRRHGMTGTPVPKLVLEWFAQQYVVDLGQSFGTKITHFRKKYFYPGGYKNYEWIPFDGTPEKMSELAGPRVHVAENLTHKTPGLHFIDEMVEIPDNAKAVYKEMLKSLVVEIDGNKSVADDLRQRYGKLRQIASGALYKKDSPTREYTEIHRAKIERVRQIVEEYRKPVIVVYAFDFELYWLRETFKNKRTGEINGHAKPADQKEFERLWCEQKLDLMFMNPKSGAHGLNLHVGGRCLVFLSLPDHPELYTQSFFRIDRRGAIGVGYVYRLMSAGTLEKDVVLKRLLTRESNQKLLIEYCKSLEATQTDL